MEWIRCIWFLLVVGVISWRIQSYSPIAPVDHLDEYELQIQILNPAIQTYYLNYHPAHLGDSGIDLPLPNHVILPNDSNTGPHELMLGIRVALYERSTGRPSSFFLIGRSSLSRSPVSLANAIGVIDAGFRGELSIRVRKHHPDSIEFRQGDRLVQICAPNLKSIRVSVVDELASYGTRGDAGWGSTGI